MRFILFVSLLMIFTAKAKAQNNVQRNSLNYSQKVLSANVNPLINSSGKIWFFSKYVGLSNNLSFFNGGNTILFEAPVGLQLNKKLNNNWYAFAGISATPAFIGFNHSFISANKLMQPNNLFLPNNCNLYPKAELGLMFINDQKTFSISGSISVEKSNYLYVPFNQFGVSRSKTFGTTNR